MCAKAIDVAGEFILLAGAEEEPELMTNLRLQKLLYYAQGWSLAIRGKELFSDPLEAWPFGPVVPAVYRKFKVHGAGAIPAVNVRAPNLEPEEKELVGRVWETYKVYSAISLSKMTHEEAPWKDARKGLSPEDKSSREISPDAMKAFFLSLQG